MALAQHSARPEGTDSQLLALRVPPHSVEAEQSLLGGLLLDNQAFDRIADLLGHGEADTQHGGPVRHGLQHKPRPGRELALLGRAQAAGVPDRLR